MGRIEGKDNPQGQFWAVCIAEGLVGFAYGRCFDEAAIIADSILRFLEISPRIVALIPIGPRLFTTEKIEMGDC